jgi:hypothetical protein
MNELPDEKPPCDGGGSTSTREDSAERNLQPGELPRQDLPREIGGRKGPEPTRFGDWEKNGRCIDF